MSTQYSTTIDPVIYGPATANFDRANWIALALAALDQAGVRTREYEQIQNLLDDAGYAMIGDEVTP